MLHGLFCFCLLQIRGQADFEENIKRQLKRRVAEKNLLIYKDPKFKLEILGESKHYKEKAKKIPESKAISPSIR